MLKSFTGTFDETGLRSLEAESDHPCHQQKDGPQSFWAVLDNSALPYIRQAYQSGQRRSALELIFAQAISAGRNI